MSTLTGGEGIVQTLIRHGVDTIFGLPGVQNDALYNALFDAKDEIRVIHTRHEQGTAYMAMGYALSSGKVGVYNVVPGPGFLNTTAALSTAYATNARVLCLVGQIPSENIGQGLGLLHEIPDQLGVLRSLTKWAERVESPADGPGLVAEAFRQMHSGRPRPVGLEVPQDVLAASSEVDLTIVEGELDKPALNLEDAEQAARMLGRSQRPVIFVGSGANEASEEVRALAEALQAPVVPSSNGRNVLSSHHYLSQYPLTGQALWPEADVILAIGTRLNWPITRWGADPDGKVIKIDVDPEEHDRLFEPALRLTADAAEALRALIPLVEKYNRARPSIKEEALAMKKANAERLAFLEPQVSYLKVIREELPEDGILVDEVTQIGYVSRLVMPVYGSRTFISPGYQGTLGYGFATALGAKVASPDKAVLSVTGDGGFMFNVQEMATAVQHGIGLVVLLFNDGAYGNVRRMQKQLYDNRIIASELRNPDFVKLAEAFGAQGLRANSMDELRSAIRQGLMTDGPTLIDIPVGEMPSPWQALFQRQRQRA
jgi:acetolactate synthase-1/2/3 large subunit